MRPRRVLELVDEHVGDAQVGGEQQVAGRVGVAERGQRAQRRLAEIRFARAREHELQVRRERWQQRQRRRDERPRLRRHSVAAAACAPHRSASANPGSPRPRSTSHCHRRRSPRCARRTLVAWPESRLSLLTAARKRASSLTSSQPASSRHPLKPVSSRRSAGRRRSASARSASARSGGQRPRAPRLRSQRSADVRAAPSPAIACGIRSTRRTSAASVFATQRAVRVRVRSCAPSVRRVGSRSH